MKLGFVGCGKMGSALLGGVLESGVAQPEDVLVFDAYPAAVEAAVAAHGVRSAPDAAALAEASDVVLLCVKPHQICELMRDLANDTLYVSIAAGVRLDALEKHAPSGSRIIRVMPNTPALVGRGASAYSLGTSATEKDAASVESILGAVGTVSRVEEKLLDAVTGLSGSGPAFIYVVIEALADSGVLMGLPRDAALQLAAQTVSGAAEMVLQTGEHPAVLRDQVTSPGGTTIAGLEALEEGGLRSALQAAVRAATERSLELGN